MKILVYDDSLDFGGHQVMACRGIEALCSDPDLEVVFAANSMNHRLWHRIQPIPNLRIMATACVSRRLQGLLNRITRQSIRNLETMIQDLAPDAVLSIQGDIEQSSQSVLAAERCGIPCISYIAIPHRLRDMGARLGALRDRLNQYLLNRPAHYITISETMKQRLIDRGVTRPISVVPNGIPPAEPVKQAAPAPSPCIGVFGRIEFKQKRQDFMLRTFCKRSETFRDCRLLFVGSGPDEEKLRALAAGGPRSHDIKLVPWTEDLEPLYREIDFLIISSRYEGVPLVMLEALIRGIPVIASACDGMQEILPDSWLFEPGNADSLRATFSAVRASGWKEIAGLQQRVQSDMTLAPFGERFVSAVKDTVSR